VDEYNDVFLAGEVFLGSACPLVINAIAGSLSNGTNILVTPSSAYPFLDYLEPNGSKPFVMMFKAPTEDADALTNYALYSDTNYAFVPQFIPNNGTGRYEVSVYPPIDIDPQNIDIIITALGQ